jgi:3-deoxy-D-manno-octulosonic-acid transferase
MLIRSTKNALLRQHWRQRFGFIPYNNNQNQAVICLHAVSVGETLGAKALIEQLISAYPQHRIVITSTTLTGKNTVKQFFGERVSSYYFPYDLLGSVQRFLQRLQPEKVIIIETEIWPNFYAACYKKSIPIILANARLSQRSMQAYLKIQKFSAETLSNTCVIAARGQQDAQHFQGLGVDPKKIVVTGNIKFDLPLPTQQIQAAEALQQQWGQQRPVWVAASTHQGEDKPLLAIHQQLLQQIPDLLLILVPRHPERFEAVYQLAQATGLAVQKRSEKKAFRPQTHIIIGDSMGEMFTWYAAADVVFMGGSLVKTGGHNPLEPAAVAKPIISGEYIFNFAEVFPLLEQVNAAWVLDTMQAIQAKLADLLQHPEKQQQAGKAAQAVIQQHQGAVAAVLEKIAECKIG